MLTQIWVIARKELRLWLQQPANLVVILLVPFLFIWIMGAVFGSSGMPTVAVFAVNLDSGANAARVLSALQDSPNLEVQLVSDRAEADRRVGQGERMAAVVIPAGFSEAVLTDSGAALELIVDPARNERASIVTGLVNAALAPQLVDAEVARGVNRGIASLLTSQDNLAGMDTGVLQEFLTAAFQGVVASQVQSAVEDPLVALNLQPVGEGPSTESLPSLMEFLVPGYTLMFAFFLVSQLATTIVEERAEGTLRRLLSTPASKAAILAGKFLPYAVIASLQILFVFFVSSLFFDFSLGSSPLALAAVILPTAAVIAALGILIAALARTTGQSSGLTILIVLILAIASGAMSPNIAVPGLQWLTPHFWAIRGFQNIITREMGLSGALQPAAVLTGMALLFFGLAVWRFRFED
jgi:ABC-2 type transport system permease protein